MASPRIGKWYTVRMIRPFGKLREGQEFQGTVRRVARMKSGAVLALLDTNGKLVFVPVSKYAEWIERR